MKFTNFPQISIFLYLHNFSKLHFLKKLCLPLSNNCNQFAITLFLYLQIPLHFFVL
nr:MAG TPA: hypothetical protein [Caudoviricetes sp.]